MPEIDPAASLIVPDWPAPPHVHAFATTRLLPGHSLPPYDACNLGLRSGEDAATVQANRALLERAFGLPSSPRWLKQVHGSQVVSCNRPHPNPPPQAGEGAERSARSGFNAACSGVNAVRSEGIDHAPELPPPLAGEGWGGGAVAWAVPAESVADAAITREAGVVLAILTADCLPVLFCSDDGAVVGAAHAGWRGLAGGVLESTVAAMGVDPSHIFAWLGPAAGAQAYEVGAEVRAAFVEPDAQAATAFVATRPGHWWCDLYALARLRLARVGVTQVFGGGLCTITDARRFYSFRRDGARSGRMASLIFIKESVGDG